MRKLPSKFSGEERLGTILANPGVSSAIYLISESTDLTFSVHKGPGGSGSGSITMSEELSAIVEGRYDIIGFDPR